MSAEPERITVTLSHDEWQWVLGLVMNSAYIRAKPIIEATEAAVKAHRDQAQQAVLQEQGERELMRQQMEAHQKNTGILLYEAGEARKTIARLNRQIDGYKGKMGQMRKQRGNGHGDEAEAPAQELIARQLADARAALQGEARARQEVERSLEESRRTVGLLQERIRTGVWPGNIPIPVGLGAAPDANPREEPDGEPV